MPDQIHSPSAFLAGLRRAFTDKPPSLPAIFQTGEAIAEINPEALPPGTPTQRIAVLGAVTIDYLSRAVACAVLRENVFPIVYQAPYGSYVQDILDPGSALHAFRPHIVVIAPHWRELVTALPIGSDTAEVDAALDAQVAIFQALWRELAAKDVKIIQHGLVPPPHGYRGSAERAAPAAPINQIRRLNDKLFAAGAGLVTWVDMEAFASFIGTSRFAPPKFWFSARLDHDQRWLPDYLPWFQAAWRQANARAKKVLVLDLDNTLWGGVIGDDGLEGIVLGAGSPAGEAFQDWQHYIKALGERGVILAVCSKNDPAIAAAAFDHPGSVLKRGDFAAFACSWDDKATGLRRIAAEMNVGIDSFVFCDDNPAECGLVRAELPEAAVVELGTEPARFIELLDAGHWLDAGSYTQEDLGRGAAYAARSAALAEQSPGTGLDAYLAGLKMTGRLYQPEEADIPRVAQLEQKTNQFNLTTRRYSDARIRELLQRNDAVVLAFQLTDKFGAHGLTSTLIAIREGGTMRIDSWLMSCRIFSRSAEAFILRGLIAIARESGATRLMGTYEATAKNGVVADLYPRLGFTSLTGGGFVRDLDDPLDDLVTQISAGS